MYIYKPNINIPIIITHPSPTYALLLMEIINSMIISIAKAKTNTTACHPYFKIP